MTNFNMTQSFAATSEGQSGTIQTFVAPISTAYTLEAAGAEGSTGSYFGKTPSSTWLGGRGARVVSKVNLKQGDILKIIVGQKGSCVQALSRDGTSGGGGGGTFVFKNISQIVDSRYQFTKSGQPFEVLLVAAGGGGANDYGYQSSMSNGYDGDASNIYSPTNYIAANTASGGINLSSSKSQGMGITQYIQYNGTGGYYTRNSGKSLGGFGGGGSNDDGACAGGGWYGSGSRAYSWSLERVQERNSGVQNGHGYLNISWDEALIWKTDWTSTDNYAENGSSELARLLRNYNILHKRILKSGYHSHFRDISLDGYLTYPFADLLNDVEYNLKKLHAFEVSWIGSTKQWVPAGSGPSYADINRWERNGETIDITLEARRKCLRKVNTFKAGNNKEVIHT